MRARSALGAILIVLGVAAAVGSATWILFDSGAASDAAKSRDADPDAKTKLHLQLHRRRSRGSSEPAMDVDAELEAAWNAAVATYRAGKPIEALTSLVQWRKAEPAWFTEPTRAALLAEMERAALAALARAVRSKSIEEIRKMAGALADLLTDPALLKQAADLLAAAERKAAAMQPTVGADIIDRADLLADKQALARHLQRFADRGPAPKTKDWIDNQLGAVEAANLALAKEPDPLPVPDPAETERRRLDELEKLRQRNSLGLLDHIDGALAWLALHQGDDGHFGGDASAARCKALGHNPPCCPPAEMSPLGATGLAVLAFLDFRDQDVKRLFEPTLSRGIRWIVSQENPDGSFAGFNTPARGYYGYEAAIAMMALGQAAASTGEPSLVDAVQRGINFCAAHHGRTRGGYRYRLDQDGDLSVTGWYAQAMEAATNAGAKVPDEMRQNIDTFLGYVTRGGRHDFAYVPDQSVSGSLAPVGMLVTSILHPQLNAAFADDWRALLYPGVPGGRSNITYPLYYGVRVLLFLDGKVPDKWRVYLNDLAAKQKVAGGTAGMITLDNEWPFARAGATAMTAFATLTLEHSLYRR